MLRCLFLALFVCLSGFSCSMENQPVSAKGVENTSSQNFVKQPVLVELFTSEG